MRLKGHGSKPSVCKVFPFLQRGVLDLEIGTVRDFGVRLVARHTLRIKYSSSSSVTKSVEVASGS